MGRKRFALWLIAGLWCGAVVPQHAAAQFKIIIQNGQLRVGNAPGQTAPETTAVFVTDRRMAQALANAKTSLAQSDYLSAIKLLQSIIDHSEDSFFQPDGEKGDSEASLRSLKVEAQRLLSQLPEEGRRLYELQFGTTADGMLRDAKQSNDLAEFEEVARRFFHTQAGYEATYVLGSFHLDQSESLAAALCFERLRNVAQVREKWEPLLSLKTALCWFKVGLRDRSTATLVELKRSSANKSVTLGGKSVAYFERDEDAIVWLNSVVGDQAGDAVARSDSWLLFRGDPSRNADSAPANVVWDGGWTAGAIADPYESADAASELLRSELESQAKRRLDNGLPLFAANQPLVVGGVAVFRSLARHNVRAVDLTSGAPLWHAAESDRLYNELFPSDQESAGVATAARYRGTLENFVQERTWRDVTTGSLSSDGEYLYAVVDSNLFSSRANPQPNSLPHPLLPQAANNMMALSLRDQGKLTWEIGGPREFGFELAGAFFLGPPLPMGNRLYCLAELDAELKLLVLKSRPHASPPTVKIDWSQTLAEAEPFMDVLQHPHRRVAALAPSFADGVLVCPTASGIVVAVDISRRLLLWMYRYRHPSRNIDPRVLMFGARFGQPMNALAADSGDQWIDSTPTIVDGRVLLTPRDSEDLHCLDLVDGTVNWKLPRRDGLYLACVHDGKVVVVESHQILAVDLNTGEPTWRQSTPIPMPSGRGFRTGGLYHIPLSSGEVATVDLSDGRIIARSPLPDGQVPGNLVAASGRLVTQTPAALIGFRPLAEVEAQIAAGLGSNPDDAQALALRGRVALHQGQEDQALADLRRSVQLRDDAPTKQLLADTMLEGLRVDFDTYRERAADLDALLPDPPRRAALLRLVAQGLERRAEHEAALAQCFKMFESNAVFAEFQQIDGFLSTRTDRWVSACLSRNFEKLPAGARADFDRRLESLAESAQRDSGADQVRKAVQFVGNHELAGRLRRELVRRLDEWTDTAEIELNLLRLRESSDAVVASEATAQIASLMIQHGRPQEAHRFVNELATRWSDVVCRDEKTGRRLADEWRADGKIGSQLTNPPLWPEAPLRAVLRTTPRANPNVRAVRGVAMTPVHVLGMAGPFFENWTLGFNPGNHVLAASDGRGIPRWVLTNPNPVGYATYAARTFGHLAVVSFGHRFIVIDSMVRTPKLRTAKDAADAENAAGNNAADSESATAPPIPKVLWARSLLETNADESTPQPVIQPAPVVVPGGQGLALFDRSYRAVGTVGVVSDDCVCYQVGTTVFAAETLAGKTLWSRRGFPRGCEIFGDRRHVVVVSGDSERATVLRATDGEQLASVSIPERGSWLTTSGASIVETNVREGKLVLSRREVVTGETLWERAFDEHAKVREFDGDEVAVLEPAGRFEILRIEDGRVILASQVDPSQELESIFVQRSDRHYVLLTKTPQKDASIRLFAAGLNQPLVNGQVHAFDRATGRRIWTTTVEDQAFKLHQPRDLPILVFDCQSAQQQLGRRGNWVQFSLIVVDKRNGEIVFQHKDALNQTGLPVSIEPNLEQQEIQVHFNGGIVAITPQNATPAD